MKATMTDVARRLGVAQSTVSRVLNGKDKGRVSSQKAALIRKTANAMGYQTNLAAVSLRNRKSYVIAILLPSLRDSFYGRLVGELEHLISATEYIANFSFWETFEDAKKKTENVLSRQVAAIITSEPRLLPDGLEVPVVSYSVPDERFDSVCYDFEQTMRVRVDYLAKLGHRKISYLVERPNDFRSEAFQKTLAEKGLPRLSRNLESPGEYFMINWDETVRNRFDRLWDDCARPTAIVAQNDATAMVVLRRAWERGIKIPEELSVVGVDNIHQATLAIPGLTTIENFAEDSAAEIILNFVLNRLRAPDAPKQRHVARGKLIERESCGPAPETESRNRQP